MNASAMNAQAVFSIELDEQELVSLELKKKPPVATPLAANDYDVVEIELTAEEMDQLLSAR